MFHGACLEALPKRLIQRDSLQVSSEDRAQMADFVLKNIFFFEFNVGVKRQKRGTTTGTKFVSPCACIFTYEMETEFLKSQELQPLLWLRYKYDIFFIWRSKAHSFSK